MAIVLKKWLGHTDIHITLDTYADVFARMDFSATFKFDALIELKEGVISIASILNKHNKGTLYFGVRDNGEVKGQEVGKETQRDISRAIAGNIKPECQKAKRARENKKARRRLQRIVDHDVK